MRSMTWRLLIGLFAVVLVMAGCTDDGGEAVEDGNGELAAETGGGRSDGTLAAVRDRGTLRCGVNNAVPGFGFLNDEGDYEGFDIDYCRAIAAGVLGDPDAVEFVPLTAEQRFTSLQSRDIDVLVRNTTWTAKRDGIEGGQFAITTFYDGQGMMVRADSEFESVDDMNNTAICVLSGTTTELNLATRFAGMSYEPVPFEDNETLQQAFAEERCDGWTSDKSQLAGVRSNWPEGPEALRILDETFSKEPLGPVVRQGDAEWFDAVNWTVNATILAEELGVSSENLDEHLNGDDIEILRFLGQPVSANEDEEPAVFDPGLGLEPDFAAVIVREVGNYGEIYARNVGPDTPLGLERDLNDLWTEGGLLYSPPYR
jgi:general L-amino acid transport system substrate-binding protein